MTALKFIFLLSSFGQIVLGKPASENLATFSSISDGIKMGLLSYPSEPVQRSNNSDGDWLMELENLQDDMVMDEIGINSGIVGERFRWRKNFFVQIDRGFVKGTKEYNNINNALYELHTTLCIDVLLWRQDVNPSGDYVFIKRDRANRGCFSFVGKKGGRQEINLQTPGCNSKGTVMHEAIHALGFLHEQSRPDRDSHVRILYENISPGKEHNFNKNPNSLTFNVPYDYTSIMHYGRNAFSKNGKDTIVAHNGRNVGSKGILTELDKTKLRRMYNC